MKSYKYFKLNVSDVTEQTIQKTLCKNLSELIIYGQFAIIPAEIDEIPDELMDAEEMNREQLKLWIDSLEQSEI